MHILPIINVQKDYSHLNQKKKNNGPSLPLNSSTDNQTYNCYCPAFKNKSYGINSIRLMFPKNKIPESNFAKRIWENCETNISNISKYNLELNPKSYEIFAKFVNLFDGDLDLNADSKIPNMKNKDLIMSFVKITQEKKSSDFYINLAKKDKALFNHMMRSIISITPEQLDVILDYKHNSWRTGTFISSCNVAYIKGQLEAGDKWAFDYVNYAQNADAKKVFDDVNTLTSAIEESKINENCILYRGDQFDGILNLIYDENGNICHLGSQIENYIKNNPQATPNEISEFASKTLIGKKFTKDRFMSMSANKELAEQWATSNMIVLGRNNSNPYGCVVFEEVLPKNNGLIFMEPYNALKDNRDDQFEFLGQRGDNHVVIDTKFDGNKKILYIKTILEHNIPKTLYPVNFPNIDKNLTTREEIIKAIDNKEYDYSWK